jgi:lipoprotein NlpD
MRFMILLLSFLLTSCSLFPEHDAAPVEDINRAPPKLHGTHLIKPGESLYEIAWRYNRDFVELAKINNLKSPYKIQPGDYIRLSSKSAVPKKQEIIAVKKPTEPVVSKPEPVLPTTVKWEWPSSGKIIQYFSSEKGQKGIDLAGKTGQPVLAAAPGVVVYSGSGLRGYGQLIILKHNDEFLSAYAHNRQLLVKEGDWVKALQQIAEMGQTDTESVRLHFEIRRKGTPVDPLAYLP